MKCDVSGQELQFPSGTCVDCPDDKYRDKDLHIKCVSCPPGTTTASSTSPATSIDDCLREYKQLTLNPLKCCKGHCEVIIMIYQDLITDSDTGDNSVELHGNCQSSMVIARAPW